MGAFEAVFAGYWGGYLRKSLVHLQEVVDLDVVVDVLIEVYFAEFGDQARRELHLNQAVLESKHLSKKLKNPKISISEPKVTRLGPKMIKTVSNQPKK